MIRNNKIAYLMHDTFIQQENTSKFKIIAVEKQIRQKKTHLLESLLLYFYIFLSSKSNK